MDKLHEYLLIILNAQAKAIENFQNMFARLPGHVYLKDTHGVYLWCNEEQARDLNFDSCEKLIGKTDYDLSEKSLADQFTYIDQCVIQEMKEIEIEEKILKNGSEAITLTKKIPVLDRNNHVIGVLGTSFDITDRKKMEEDLRIAKEAAEAASLAKSAFIANISHDTRTPLTGVVELSARLEEPVISDADRIQYATMVHESGEALLEFSENVLEDVTINSMSEDDVVCKAFDVRKVINDVVIFERPTIEVKHLHIQVNIDDDLPIYLMGDKLKLHRILLNLTGNAIKFTEVGGVTLNAHLLSIIENNATIEFSVTDTGIGIAPEHQNKVFDQFFKVTPSYKGLYKGYGLGLHIVQKFIALIGGEIRLESELGVGTKISFIVTMKIGEKPLVDEKVKLGQSIARRIDVATEKKTDFTLTEAPQPIDEDKLQVLLVEDNNTAMIVLKTLVQKFNVQISTAIDAERAFDLVKSQAFHLVITDLGLPGKQGDDLSRMIREYEIQQRRQPMMIIGLTGHAVEEIAAQCIDAGMNEVFRKPMALKTLSALMDALIKSETSVSKTTPSSGGGLGVDLPNTESELFELSHYPLFDVNVGVQIVGSEDVLRSILKDLKADAIDEDLALIKKAHAEGDWTEVEKLAHKMKGGSDFGTVRMHYALLYMERYRKAGHTKLSEELYAQMLQVVDETMAYLDKCLKSG